MWSAGYEIFDENEQPVAVNDLPGRRAMAGGAPSEAIVGFRTHGSTETRWSIVRGASVRGGDGEVTHVVNTFRDVTEDRWQRLARVYMADAIVVLSSILDVEEAAQRLADVSVPRLADYCTVSLLQPDGSIKLVALAVRQSRAHRARP